MLRLDANHGASLALLPRKNHIKLLGIHMLYFGVLEKLSKTRDSLKIVGVRK